MSHLSFWRKFAIAFAFVVALSYAHAADVNGRIKGTVKDSTGAVVPKASVTATNEATGVKFTTTASAAGEYIFPQLPVGTYDISATAPGFKTFTATGIILNIDQEYVEAVKLDIGSATEGVTVEADAVQVNTTDMQLSGVVNSSEMVELPLIGRNFTTLETIQPGVQLSSDRFGTYSVQGQQTQQSEFLINGADSNDIALNTLAIAPNLDAIDQFNLISGPLNAEYDRNGGGIVSATIKQGTNKFHGDAFEFYRDTFMNTLSFFQKTLNQTTGKYTGTVSPYHQNIFGGTIGGPVIKDKLFFFAAYQGIHQRVPDNASNATYSTGANGMLGGNWQSDNPSYATARPAYNPATGCATELVPAPTTANPNATAVSSSWGNYSGCNQIPSTISIPNCTTGEYWSQCAYDRNGIFPTTSYNSISTGLVSKYVPAPNDGTYGYIFNGVTKTSSNQEIGRLDYSLNPKNQLTVLGIYFKSNVTDTLPFTGASLPGFGDQNIETIQQYTVDYVRQLSATAVNDLAVHWTRFNYQAVEPQNVVTPASLGFNIVPQDLAAASVPTIGVSGNAVGFTLGFSTNGPQPRIDQVYQIDETVSKTLGHHQLKFGYDGRRFNVSNPFSADNSGAYGFANTGTYSTGDGALDFLLGIPASYAQGSGAAIQADAFLNYFFAQDTWKVTDAFTFNYGLGYSIDTPLENHQYGGEGIACLVPGQQSVIYPTAPLGINYPGDPHCSDSGQAKTRYSEFGPRIGFAWAPDLGWLSAGNAKKFSIRGGFGIYYDRTEEESSLQTLETPPNGAVTYGAGDFGGSPAFANPFADINGGGSEANKFPYAFPAKGTAIPYSTWATLEPVDISTYGPSFRAPYSENFQISVERELPSHIVTRVTYVGSLSRHNQITYEGNPETAAGHAACQADTTYCASPKTAYYRGYQPYFFPSHTASGFVDPNTGVPAIYSVGTVGSEASSSYHSLQVNVEKAVTHGLFFQLSYTYAHALDTASSFENAGFGESSTRGYNQFNTALNYGDAQFDVRNHLVFAPIYVVPKLAGSWYSAKNLALSGWQISGIMTLAQGFPYDVSYAGGTSDSLWCPNYVNFYACPDIPNQVGKIQTSNPRIRNTQNGNGQWLSKNAFANEGSSGSAVVLGYFGNTHRNPAHGPGVNNTNLVVAKNFLTGSSGKMHLQLRLESDNVFNHTQFTNPGTTWSDTTLTTATSTFGQTGGTQSARQTQLAAKFYF